MVNKSSIQVSTTVDPVSGLKMFRKVDKCILEIDQDRITVWYYQWLESPNGTKLNEAYKSYIVKNEPAMTYMEGEGENKVEVVKPANNSYDTWADFTISQNLVGASLGNDIIIGAINRTLKEMAFDVPHEYITQP